MFCDVALPSKQATLLFTAGTAPPRLCAQVLKEVCRVSNWLRSVGVKKGDSVAIYMPMVCEVSPQQPSGTLSSGGVEEWGWAGTAGLGMAW